MIEKNDIKGTLQIFTNYAVLQWHYNLIKKLMWTVITFEKT